MSTYRVSFYCGSDVSDKLMYGHDEIVPVTLTEDPDGPYYGWIYAGEEKPTMIQQHPGLFRMQFPYGPEAEEARDQGRIVRLRVEET